jgi:ankyrin repeat protein
MVGYARLFVEFGVDATARNHEGKSALDYAQANHHQTVVDFLAAHRSDK